MKISGALAALLLLTATSAFSQGRDVTLFVGAQIPGNITLKSASTTATPLLTDPTNAGTFGLRVGHGKMWGGEHTLAFTSKFLDGKSKSFIYNSNFRLQAPLPVVRPYITAGAGTVWSWGGGVSDVGAKFAVNYGGGLKIMPAGPVGVRFDIRQYFLPKVQSQTLKISEVSAGVVFGF